MATKRTLKQSFIKYVSLNVFGMIGLSCYILADTFFIARGVGSIGLTALNIALPVYGFQHGVGLMIGMGGATRFSISKAEGKRNEGIFTQALYMAVFFVAIFFSIGLFL
jgi:Na+-driven multidrug efflux pump